MSTVITVLVPQDVNGVELINDGPIAVGASTQLEALVSPVSATNQNVVFNSDDTSIATVSSTGLLTAISEGIVSVTVTSDEGGFVDSKMIQILNPSTEFNWALGQPTLGTGTPDGSNVEANLVDDSTGTRWSVQEFPQSVTVDLEGDIEITRTEVTCYEDRAYEFIIEGAANLEGPYTTIVDRSMNRLQGTPATPIINTVESLEFRFVRITVLGAAVYDGAWASGLRLELLS